MDLLVRAIYNNLPTLPKAHKPSAEPPFGLPARQLTPDEQAVTQAALGPDCVIDQSRMICAQSAFMTMCRPEDAVWCLQKWGLMLLQPGQVLADLPPEVPGYEEHFGPRLVARTGSTEMMQTAGCMLGIRYCLTDWEAYDVLRAYGREYGGTDETYRHITSLCMQGLVEAPTRLFGWQPLEVNCPGRWI